MTKRRIFELLIPELLSDVKGIDKDWLIIDRNWRLVFFFQGITIILLLITAIGAIIRAFLIITGA